MPVRSYSPDLFWLCVNCEKLNYTMIAAYLGWSVGVMTTIPLVWLTWFTGPTFPLSVTALIYICIFTEKTFLKDLINNVWNHKYWDK